MIKFKKRKAAISGVGTVQLITASNNQLVTVYPSFFYIYI